MLPKGLQLETKTSFSIQHYNSKIEYDVESLVANNREPLGPELLSVLRRCLATPHTA